MASSRGQRKPFIVLGFLGLALCGCVVLVAVIAFIDPFNLGVGAKVLSFFAPTPTPTPTPRPTPDPCLRTQGTLILGCPAPDFNLTTFEGQEITLANLRGKVIVINFWASWAKPCEGDVISLQGAWKHYLERGDVMFVGIAWVDTEQKAGEFIQEFTLTYPIGMDIQTRIAQAYRITGVPETYIVDKNGLLAFIKIGQFSSVDEISEALGPLLAP